MYRVTSLRACSRVGYSVRFTRSFLRRGVEDPSLGIILAHTGTTHGTTDTQPVRPVSEILGRRGLPSEARGRLNAPVGMKDHVVGKRIPLGGHLQRLDDELGTLGAPPARGGGSAIAYPMHSLVWQSMTVARYNHPSQVRMYVGAPPARGGMSPTSSVPGPVAEKSRSTRSGRPAASPATVVLAPPRGSRSVG
jgi:hypothetical protein